MVIVLLHCGHAKKVNDTPRVDEKCEKCGAVVLVREDWREQWFVSCADCGYRSRHGYLRKAAEEAERAHRRLTGHGTVRRNFYADAPAYVLALLETENSLREAVEEIRRSSSPPF